MKYPAYSEYRDSGVSWLGQIPAHWEVKRLGYIVLLKSGESITSQQIAEGGEYPVYGGNGLRGYYSENTHDGVYVLIGRQGALCGNINYACGKFWASEHAVVVNPLKRLEVKWIGELLRAMNLNQYSISAAQPGLSVSQIASLKVPVPTDQEQKNIAEYLEFEIGRIDALVKKKANLIALLKEKRTALISQTVTRGLPEEVAREFGLQPHGRFKDSGIEWLEQVPEDWDVWKLAHACMHVLDGTHFSPESTAEGDRRYITAKNIKEWGIDLSNVTYVSECDHREIYNRCPVRRDDVLYIKDGATAGIATINTLEEEFSLLSSVALLRPRLSVILPKYLAYQMNTRDFKRFVLNSLVGGAMTRFTLEIISKFKLIAPPLYEQSAIVTHLDIETSKIDCLLEKIEAAIERLQELRTALITAAVTGKIDVRSTLPQKDVA